MQNLNNINLSELLTEIIYSKFDEFDTEFNSEETDFHQNYLYLVDSIKYTITKEFKIKPETIIKNLNSKYIQNIINKNPHLIIKK
tara:strand:- start:185 stop:439 length:255 start_codon:yes stop_codon:yes gene_type:complete